MDFIGQIHGIKTILNFYIIKIQFNFHYDLAKISIYMKYKLVLIGIN